MTAVYENGWRNVSFPGVTVHMTKLNASNSFTTQAISNESGAYSFTDLTPGLYELSVYVPGYFEISQDVIIRVSSGSSVYNLELRAISDITDAGNGAASGTIYDAKTGRPITTGITMKLRQGINKHDTNIVYEGLVNNDGSYNVTLPAGHYTVQLEDQRPATNGEKRYGKTYFNIIILGGSVIPDQNHTMSEGLFEGQLRIVLQWGATPRDLDSHLIGPRGTGGNFHIFYSAKNYYENNALYANLDVDDTTSYGPETTTIYTPTAGTYAFYVYNYTGGSDAVLPSSGAWVEVYSGNSDEAIETFYVPNTPGRTWKVFEYDSSNGLIIPINKNQSQNPGNEPGGVYNPMISFAAEMSETSGSAIETKFDGGPVYPPKDASDTYWDDRDTDQEDAPTKETDSLPLINTQDTGFPMILPEETERPSDTTDETEPWVGN